MNSKLALIYHDNTWDHLSRYRNSGSTSSSDGYYEEHFDDPNPSSFGFDFGLTEEHGSLLIFFHDWWRSAMEGCLRFVPPTDAEIALYDQIIS